MKTILDDIGLSLALYFHNCKEFIDIEEWPQRNQKINTTQFLSQIDISNPNFDPQKEFNRFKIFIEDFKEHTNKFYGPKTFNLAEYYIWSIREIKSDDIILITIWEKSKLIKKIKQNHWKIN